MGKIQLALKIGPWVIVALLGLLCWHYRGSADSWQQTASKQQNRADTLQAANAGLADTITDLNSRNTTLVDSLNARTDELKQQTQRADANRRAYREALVAHSDWGNTRVPDGVARSLQQSTADIHSDTRGSSKDTK